MTKGIQSHKKTNNRSIKTIQNLQIWARTRLLRGYLKAQRLQCQRFRRYPLAAPLQGALNLEVHSHVVQVTWRHRAKLPTSSFAALRQEPLTYHTTAPGLCGAPKAAKAALRGRTACVTGASRGIGKGIAIALGEAGARVFVTGRRRKAVEGTAELVSEAGGEGRHH